MKWSEPKKRYELPDEPGFITRSIWFLEDWWREIGGGEKALWGFVFLIVALAIYTLCFAK